METVWEMLRDLKDLGGTVGDVEKVFRMMDYK